MTVAVDSEARALARVGSVLKEKYRLDALLGSGGMAVVYSATHRNAKRVAIKMLLPEFSGDQDVRGRFVREGYAANTIEHPGALSVLDDDVSEEGLPYLVMELLEGETVEAYWARSGGRLDLAEVLAMTGALLDVLAAAHAKGVVHRDIKPENLFLVRGGGLKVLDFGIARVLEGTRARTSTRVGTVMGTPAFMSPEQALARWDEVDGRTDLWAVGATMFTLLTGQYVHDGATGNEQLIKSATTPARSIATVVKGLPRSVVALVDRALAFDRLQRWPDAKSMNEGVRGAYEALTGTPLVVEAPAQSGSGALSSRRTTSSGEGASQRRTTSGEMRAPPTRPSANMKAQAPPLPPPRTTSQSTMLGVAGPPRTTSQSTMLGVAGAQPRRSSGAMGAVRASPSGSFPQTRATPTHASESALGIGHQATMASQAGPAESAGGLAPPAMSAFSVDAFVAGRTAERDAAATEVARLQPVVAEVQARLAAVRRRVAAAQEQIAATRKERAADDDRHRRQTNARLEGVGEARKAFRRAMGEVARIALADAKTFPPDFGAAERVEIEKTRTVADARGRESALHEAALVAYDPKALKTGVALAIGGAILFLLLFFSPVIIRSFTADTGTLAPPPSAPP